MGVERQILIKDNSQIPYSGAGGQGKVFLSCLGPSTVTSVLSEFNNRKLQDIQDFMSLRPKTNKQTKKTVAFGPCLQVTQQAYMVISCGKKLDQEN